MTEDDDKQLGLLSTLHYISAALACAIPLIGGGYAAFGIALVLGKLPGGVASAPRAFGWLPIVVGTVVGVLGGIAVTFNVLTARWLRDRKHHTLCVLTAALNCMHFPLGSLLGTFTLVVLCRPAVRAAFESPESSPAERHGDSPIPVP